MPEQLDMMRQMLGDEAFFEQAGAEGRSIAREIAILAGFKVIAAENKTTVSAISMGTAGANDRDVQLGWLPSLAAHDPDRRLGAWVARLYGCVLTPVPKVTPEHKLRLIEQRVKERFGPSGDALLDELKRETGL
jgi:hypothetical protein